MEESAGIATALCPYIGYARAAQIAKEALKTNKTVRELVIEKGLMSGEKLKKILDPYAMTDAAAQERMRP